MYLKKVFSNSRKLYFPFLFVFLMLVYVPEILTWITLPKDMVFNGGFLNITDFNVYLSAIRQGSEGAWLFEPQFTPESIPAYFAFFPYMLAGKLMSLLGGDVIFWFQILKFLSLVWALISLIALLGIVFPQHDELQISALFMLLFSSGLGWVVLPFTGELSLSIPDLYFPEWNLLTSAFASPHFLFGIGFQATLFRSLLSFFRASVWKQAVPIAIAGLGLSLTYPYLTPVNGLAISSYLIYQTIATKKIPWQQILILGTACAPMIITLGYYGLYLPQDPLYQVLVISNNEIHPPPLYGLLIGFGLLLILAALGIRPWIKEKRHLFVLFWLTANLVAIYLPFSFSGRFILGAIIPVCLIAAYGMERIMNMNWPSQRRKISPNIRNVFLILTIPSSALFVLNTVVAVNINETYPYYHKQSMIDAATWLSNITTNDDLLLAEFPMSNLFPRYGKGHVFKGHFDLTMDIEGKSAMVENFWLPDTTPQWRQDLIDEWNITYIYQRLYENTHAQDEQLVLPYEIIYQTKEDRIYRIP